MALPNDREQLRRSFISIFVEHPVITLLAAMLAGALVFAMYLTRHRPISNYAGRHKYLRLPISRPSGSKTDLKGAGLVGFPLTLMDLAGSVALLLWGVHMVQTGVQRAFGAKLRSFLGSALRNRFKAFFAGIGVTALLQSSTATGLMVTGFAAGGLVDLVPALAVMLGANVGTTLIVQVLSFDVAEVAPALILIGVLMFRRASAGPRDFGRVLIGLGLVLMALHQFVDLLLPYENSSQPADISRRGVHPAHARCHYSRSADLGSPFKCRSRPVGHVFRGQGDDPARGRLCPGARG